MTDERPNPDIFWTDEEVADLKEKGIINTKPTLSDKKNVCCDCGKPLSGNETTICDSCIPF